MTVLDDLLASLPPDARIRSLFVGANWTIVYSRHAGMAATLKGSGPHGESRVADAGRLHEKTAHELIRRVRSDNPLEVSIGVATLNSLLDVDEARAVEINAIEVLERRGRGRHVALVGHFPFIPRLRAVARQLWVIEENPLPDEYSPAEAAALIPQADVVAITASTLINGTLDGLLELCRSEALVMLLGPSTPLSSVLFDHGIDLLAGIQVVDFAAAMRTIGQGAILPQVEGLRRLTLAREGEAVI